MKRILISTKHHGVYAVASRRLVGVMGRTAPDVTALIRHELSMRKARMIADEYLDHCGWRRHGPREGARKRIGLPPSISGHN